MNDFNPFKVHIYWKHITPLDIRNKLDGGENPQPRTICFIKNNGEIIATGEAFMSKNEKQFVKETGRKLSFKRALAQLRFCKRFRECLWARYFLREDDMLKELAEVFEENPIPCFKVK